MNFRILRALYLGAVIGATGVITLRRVRKPQLLADSLVFPVSMHRDLTDALDSGYTNVKAIFLGHPKTGGLYPIFSQSSTRAGIDVDVRCAKKPKSVKLRPADPKGNQFRQLTTPGRRWHQFFPGLDPYLTESYELEIRTPEGWTCGVLVDGNLWTHGSVPVKDVREIVIGRDSGEVCRLHVNRENFLPQHLTRPNRALQSS